MIWPTYIMIIVAVLIILSAGIKVINEYERAVVLRLGRLVGTRGPGNLEINERN